MRWFSWVFSVSWAWAPFSRMDLLHWASSLKPEIYTFIHFKVPCLKLFRLFVCFPEMSNTSAVCSEQLHFSRPATCLKEKQQQQKPQHQHPSHWRNVSTIPIYFYLGDLYDVTCCPFQEDKELRKCQCHLWLYRVMPVVCICAHTHTHTLTYTEERK